MKGIFAVLLFSSLLVGCTTTPSKMRDTGPDEVHTRFRTPKEIYLCIAPQWEEYVVVNARESQKGYSLTGMLGVELKYMADIDETERGSKTKIYTFKIMEIGRDPLKAAAAKCQ